MKTVVMAIGLGAWAGCGAFAQDQAKPQGTSGSMVFVDPATRQIRKPGASEIGARRAQSQAAVAARPTTAPVVIHGPGGAIGVLLDDRHGSFMVATRKADGKIALECVTGKEAADHAVKSPEAAPETK